MPSKENTKWVPLNVLQKCINENKTLKKKILELEEKNKLIAQDMKNLNNRLMMVDLGKWEAENMLGYFLPADFLRKN